MKNTDRRDKNRELGRIALRVPRGGVVLLSSYAHRGFELQYKAMNDLGREIGFDILTTASGQGIIIK